MIEITNKYGSSCKGRYFIFENDMELNIILKQAQTGDYRHIFASNKYISSIPNYVLDEVKKNPNTILLNTNTNASNKTRKSHHCNSFSICCGTHDGDYTNFTLVLHATTNDIKSDLSITNIEDCKKC